MPDTVRGLHHPLESITPITEETWDAFEDEVKNHAGMWGHRSASWIEDHEADAFEAEKVQLLAKVHGLLHATL